jgi:hypothetical protein
MVLKTIMTGQNFWIYECILNTPLQRVSTIPNKLLNECLCAFDFKFKNLLILIVLVCRISRNINALGQKMNRIKIPTKPMIPVILHHTWGFENPKLRNSVIAQMVKQNRDLRATTKTEGESKEYAFYFQKVYSNKIYCQWILKTEIKSRDGLELLVETPFFERKS